VAGWPATDDGNRGREKQTTVGGAVHHGGHALEHALYCCKHLLLICEVDQADVRDHSVKAPFGQVEQFTIDDGRLDVAKAARRAFSAGEFEDG
jgi:hypothetical protein